MGPAFWGDLHIRVTRTDNSTVLDFVLGFPLSRHIRSSHKGIREVKQLAKITQLAQGRTRFLPSLADSGAGFPSSPTNHYASDAPWPLGEAEKEHLKTV